jgi:hypothetical protein
MKECCIKGCDKPGDVAHGMCWQHYRNMLRNGNPISERSWGVNDGKTCAAIDCENLSVAKGYCAKHYERLRNGGDPNKKRDPSYKHPCKVEGCNKPGARRGYCQSHYAKLQRYGDPNAPDHRKKARQ